MWQSLRNCSSGKSGWRFLSSSKVYHSPCISSTHLEGPAGSEGYVESLSLFTFFTLHPFSFPIETQKAKNAKDHKGADSVLIGLRLPQKNEPNLT